jgi:DNA-binding HxlR family transcriptional regulator
MSSETPAVATNIYSEAFFLEASECSVETWLAFLGHRWNALVLYHLSLGPKRFGEILKCLPTLSPKVLAERLASLELHALVASDAQRGYRLTRRAETLMPILHQLEVWSRSAD